MPFVIKFKYMLYLAPPMSPNIKHRGPSNVVHVGSWFPLCHYDPKDPQAFG